MSARVPSADLEASPRRWVKLVPWVSLGLGVFGAVSMDRGPARARLVAIVAGLAWLLVLASLVLHRPAQAEAIAKWRRGVWWTSLAAAQWAIQLALFFALPFFWRAWAGTIPQLGFLVLLTAAALFSLWDPWTEKLLHRPGASAMLPAIACFAALAAVLPGFGLSNSQSLWGAAIATAAALPVGLVHPPNERVQRRRFVLGTLGAMALLPLALLLGAARCVPAAPLALIDAEIGTRQKSRGVADPIEHLEARPHRLVCATSIWAPLGVRERLFHVWRQNGQVRDRIELEIAGGREDGFRTWSSKRNFGDDPAGRWSCAVETAMGQSLGAREIVVEP